MILSTKLVYVLMALLAGGFAAALYGYLRARRRLHTEQRRSRRQALLNRIQRLGISTFNQEEMLEKVAQEIQRHFSPDYVGIGLVDFRCKEMKWTAEAGIASSASGRRIPLEQALGGAGSTGEGELIQEGAPEFLRAGLLANRRSQLCVPIRHDETTLGVLNVESLQPNAFPPEEQELYHSLADFLGDALENAALFHRTQEQAITDGLTGLKTRRYFSEVLQAEWKRAIRTGRQFSVLLLDLDRFKAVNDNQGHLEGDRVLAELGELLKRRSRQSNVVARYGGDEFIILVPEASPVQADTLAEHMRLWIASEPSFQQKQLTASFGFASFPAHGSTPEEIVRAADTGLYLSKNRGKDCVSSPEPSQLPEEVLLPK